MTAIDSDMTKRPIRPPRAEYHAEQFPGPTPETAAKLQRDPLLAVIAMTPRADDRAILEEAADEICAVYMAVVRAAMRKGGLCEDRGGMPGVPAFLAWCHAQTYLPWARSQDRYTLRSAIDLIVERVPIAPHAAERVLASLQDYANRIYHRSKYEGED